MLERRLRVPGLHQPRGCGARRLCSGRARPGGALRARNLVLRYVHRIRPPGKCFYPTRSPTNDQTMKIKTIRLKTRHRRKGRATSLWNILTGKWGKNHRLPAHVTGESDWEVEVPQIRMSRAFAVMLVLHIVAVGGLFAFRIWGRDAEKKDAAAESADA